jgi:nitrogen regulatory protein PII
MISDELLISKEKVELSASICKTDLTSEIVVSDEIYEDVVSTITEKAKTGKIGDGKVFVTNVVNAVRIRTGEDGDDAL